MLFHFQMSSLWITMPSEMHCEPLPVSLYVKCGAKMILLTTSSRGPPYIMTRCTSPTIGNIEWFHSGNWNHRGVMRWFCVHRLRKHFVSGLLIWNRIVFFTQKLKFAHLFINREPHLWICPCRSVTVCKWQFWDAPAQILFFFHVY